MKTIPTLLLALSTLLSVQSLAAESKPNITGENRPEDLLVLDNGRWGPALAAADQPNILFILTDDPSQTSPDQERLTGIAAFSRMCARSFP